MDPNVKFKTIKLLEENIEENLNGLEFSDILGTKQERRIHERKIDKSDFIKIKIICCMNYKAKRLKI